MSKKYVTHITIGFFALWAVAYASISANYPTIFSPFSFVVIVPGMALSQVISSNKLTYFLFGTLITPVTFVLWSFPLLRGQTQIPKRSKIGASLLVALSLYSLIGSWPYGVIYQGVFHTVVICIWNVICWFALFFLNRSNSIRQSYWSNYLFHWIFFAWLAWVAFPWLGELP